MKKIILLILAMVSMLLLSSSRQHQVFTIPDIYFLMNSLEYNSAIAKNYPHCIYPDCYEKIVELVNSNPEMGRLELRGHQGKDEKTKKLSAERMNKVKAELVKRGVADERIILTDLKTAVRYNPPEGMEEAEVVMRNYRVSLNLPDVRK